MKKKIKKQGIAAANSSVFSDVVQSHLGMTYSYWYWIGIPVILAIATFYAYSHSLHYAFQFDDIDNITKHFRIRTYTFSELFFSGSRWLSYWLNSVYYAFGKFDPYLYRLGNICIHIATGVMIFFLLLLGLSRRYADDFFKQHADSIATVSALLFLLHPVQTQTVSYVIQGQLEGLSALCMVSMMLTFLLFCYTRRTVYKLITAALLCALACFACGTKEIAIISPLLVFVIDWFFIAQGITSELKKRLWLHALLTAIVFFWYVYFLNIHFFTDVFSFSKIAYNNGGNVITNNAGTPITPFSFLISQPKVILHYLWIFIWPFSLSAEYDCSLSESLFSSDCLVSLTVLCSMAYAVVLYSYKTTWSNMILFSACWFFVCMAPRASIIPSPELIADYKTYLASVAWLFLLASGIVWISSMVCASMRKKYTRVPGSQILQNLAIIGLLIPFGIGTMQRNTVWRSGLEFWGNIIQNAPLKARAYNNYGFELSQHFRRFQEAIPYFEKAIELDPFYADPCNNVAVAYGQTNQKELALKALNRSLQINPLSPEAYNNFASFLLQEEQNKQYDKAIVALQKALELRPHYGKALFNLGRVAYEQEKYEQAWHYFRDACMKGDLDTDMGFNAYAKMSLFLKKYDDAIVGYTKTLEFLPDDQDTLFNLATAYFLADKKDKALATYEHLLRIYPQDLRAWHNKGELYYGEKQPEQALYCFEKTMASPLDFPNCYVRTAQCYEQLGNYTAAYKILDAVLAKPYNEQSATTALSFKKHLQAEQYRHIAS